MNFYRRRPLALAISICLLASAAAAFLPGFVKLVLMALIAVCVPISALAVKRAKGFMPSVMPMVFISAALSLAVLLTSYVYHDVYAERHSRLTKGNMRAVVTDIKSETEYSASYTVRLKSVDGKHYGGKGTLYSEASLSLGIGDIIETDAVFNDAAEGADYVYGASDDDLFYCISDGDVDVRGSSSSPEIMLVKLRRHISAVMGIYLDPDTSAMADALFLGVRDGLGVIRRDFKYLGIMHILALSGMHIVVLTGFADRLLKFFRVGKRARNIAVPLFAVLYIALTGFLLSAVRAAIMLLITYAAAILGHRSDRVTSLFMAVYLIVLVNPPSVGDVGLQMSFFATLGVILMTEAVERYNSGGGKLPWLLKYISCNTASSVGAVMFVLPLQWLYFGELSPMSLPATLIISLACEGMLILLLPYAVFALVGWHFGAGVLGTVITLIYRLCAFLAAELAELSSLISLRYAFALPIIIICIAVIAVMMVCNVKNWLWALIPFGASAVIFFACVGIHNSVYSDSVTVSYANFGSHDVLCAVAGDSAVVFDCTGGSSGASGKVSSVLSEQYVTEVDTYVVSDLTLRHINALRALLKNRVVHTVLVPSPMEEEDVYLINELIRLTDEYRTEAVMYSRIDEAEMSVGAVKITMPKYTKLKRSTKALGAIRFECGDRSISYMGCSAWESDYITEFVSGSDEIIIGSYGPNLKTLPDISLMRSSKSVYWVSEELGTQLGQLSLTGNIKILPSGWVYTVFEP